MLGTTPWHNITIITAIKVKKKLTIEKIHFSIGKIYFGIYTFLISGAELKIDDNDNDVASEKKFHEKHAKGDDRADQKRRGITAHPKTCGAGQFLQQGFQ